MAAVLILVDFFSKPFQFAYDNLDETGLKTRTEELFIASDFLCRKFNENTQVPLVKSSLKLEDLSLCVKLCIDDVSLSPINIEFLTFDFYDVWSLSYITILDEGLRVV